MRVKPKKRLGQNFLIDKNIRKKIIEAAGLTHSDIVLEIGPGKGELTELAVEKASYIYAVEIDTQLSEILTESFKERANITIINQDILKFDFKEFFQNIDTKIKVIGNIPYYISTPIIEKLLNYREKIESIFITVQKEFAQRIISTGGSKKYGSLSCFLQYYTIPRIIFTISKTCFRPIPKVDSCLLKLQIRKEPAVKVKDEKLLFKIIRAVFNKRRKTLRNSLKDIIPSQKLELFFKKYPVDKNIRPESLKLQDFANLADI
ncbi:MAG: 16S rRNA (adenine(1518)-N(6)/adenine(1519)-N(6))-dimethyltransferase RsmA [Candidatus Omnitrophota bacterium]